MKNIFKVLFCNNISLTQLSHLLNQEEDRVIEMLNGTLKMTSQEKSIIEELLGEELNI